MPVSASNSMFAVPPPKSWASMVPDGVLLIRSTCVGNRIFGVSHTLEPGRVAERLAEDKHDVRVAQRVRASGDVPRAARLVYRAAISSIACWPYPRGSTIAGTSML